MDNILSLTKGTSKNRLNDLANTLFTTISYTFDKTLPFTMASTSNSFNGHANKIRIGIYDIEQTKFNLFRPSKISDKVFATVILNMYHEHMYCIQKNELFRQTHLDIDTANQLVQEIACMDNHDYYFDNGNYKINANEIQAEKEGIVNTYQYLCDEFPEVNPADHEHIILDIVNDKMLNSTYFVSSPTPFQVIICGRESLR